MVETFRPNKLSEFKKKNLNGSSSHKISKNRKIELFYDNINQIKKKKFSVYTEM